MGSHGRPWEPGIIPLAILSKPPSAELAPGQQDTDSLPAYEILDELLKLLIENQQLPAEEFRKAQQFVLNYRSTAEGEAVYQRIVGLIARNEYKRPSTSHHTRPPTRLWSRPTNANCGKTLFIAIAAQMKSTLAEFQ